MPSLVLAGEFEGSASGAIEGVGRVATLKAEEVEKLIRDGVPMAEDIDFRVERVDEGVAVARVPFNERLVRPGGTLSGPVQMALADAAMYAAVLGTLGRCRWR